MATKAAEPRARRYDPAETRQRVLEAANHLFSTKGFAGTGTADIARAADVSEGSIFYHFGSKRSLLEELGRAYGDRMVEAMQRDDPLENLEPGITIRRCFDYCATHNSWEKLVAANSEDGKKSGMHANADAEPFYRTARDVVVHWCEEQYKAMAEKRGIDLDCEIAAALTHSAVGAALDMAFGPDAEEGARRRVEDETVRFIRAACGVEPAHWRD